MYSCEVSCTLVSDSAPEEVSWSSGDAFTALMDTKTETIDVDTIVYHRFV